MPTIPGSLRSTARCVPGDPALAFGDRAYTYAELDAAVDRTASALAGLGLRRGDRFALMASNSDRFVVTFYAALRCGAIVVPVNPASAPPEIAYLLEDSGAAVFAFDPAAAAAVTMALEAGARRPAPAAVLDTLESERITMFFGVPTMYQFLLRLPDLADRDLSCWRTGLFGAAPMPASAVERLVTALPQVNFIQLCGQTEAGPGARLRDGATITLDDVRAFLRDRLTGYKIPHDIVTGAIPRNPSGKVLKHKLRAAVAQQRATAS
jgi:acyl-CoA synthetase (AMP-forming)/AMP-acid ligase II